MRRRMLAGGAMLPFAAVMARVSGQTPADRGAGEDPLLAACLLMKGRRQIETCKWAQQKSHNEDVKAFLKAEIDEHEGMKAKLKTMNYDAPTPVRAANAPAAGAQPMLSVGAVMIPPPASQLLLVDNEVVDQCIANYKANMEKKNGVKLEKAIIGDQLHEHMALLDHAQVFSKHASAGMQPALKEALTVIQTHIATLEQVMEKLDAMKP